MPTDPLPLILAGARVSTAHAHEVRNKHTGQTHAAVCAAGDGEVERAIAACAGARAAMGELPAHARRDILAHTADRLHARRDELARTLVAEVGKTIRDARAEVDRAADTFRIGAEEATRINGQWLPLDSTPRGEKHNAIVARFPVGACSFIVPFNFPLNLAAHKVAPAIAAGCPFVLKPDSDAPLAVLALADILLETDLPRVAMSVMPVLPDAHDPLSKDERFALLSFTGSPKVGWMLKAQAGRKKVHLELGGNAPCIVDETADLDRAAERIAFAGYAVAGQSCISVQRVLAVGGIYEPLRERLAARVKALRTGDPIDEATDVGPLFRESDVQRIDQWVREAVDAGARVIVGGKPDGRFYAPTLVQDVDPRARLSCQEVFGPVVVLSRCDTFEDALAQANDSPFGLQAGVFTADIRRAFDAFRQLEFGGVNINDVPTMRLDAMPYGGIKQSGLGREGLRWAIEEMTEPRQLLLCNI